MTPKKNTREGSYPALLAVESVGNFHPLVKKKNSLVRCQRYFGKLVSPVLRWLWHELIHSLQRYAVRSIEKHDYLATWHICSLFKWQFFPAPIDPLNSKPQLPIPHRETALHSLSPTEVDVSYEWHHWLAKPGPSLPASPPFFAAFHTCLLGSGLYDHACMGYAESSGVARLSMCWEKCICIRN